MIALTRHFALAVLLTALAACVDALRQDLVRMPEMSADELKTFIPEHQSRITKLREMHRGMMANMKM